MCDLCDQSTRLQAQATHHFIADQLESLAKSYRSLADGRIKPHSSEVLKVNNVAKSVIRTLVNDWV